MIDFQKLASNPLKIRLEDIKLATNNFANDNFIGQGGFGRVYKGQLKSSSGEADIDVAVKMLDVKYGQGQHEFGNEILLLASYKHNNIVSLVGFCDEEGTAALIYKYEVHGSLDRHLANTDLTWEQRLQICLGAAHGLEYLHGSEGAGGVKVIHRDIKSSKILLDANWEAKISDFGLTKLGLTGQEISFTYTNIVGTHGYTDPQYYTTGKLTKKSDVFSFGVVMLEVLCGRPGFVEYHDERSFLYTLAKKHYEAGEIDKLIIPDLLKQLNSLSLKKFSKIAYDCLNDDRKKRPNMTYIIRELKAALELQLGKVEQTELWGSSRGGDPWSYLFINNRKLRKFRLEDIKQATNNFAKDNFIGQGGFGRVYKGQLKSSSGEPDTDVAVKMLDENSYISGQGQHEFGNEILMLASYKHNNIVSLVGFCDEEGKKALIYKHEVHGSLDRHLDNTDLTWEQRLQICLGAACGLEYLHDSEGAREHRVIHRDIKSSNILLDANWEAKISDFGLAKLGLTGQEISVMYTKMAGTIGYIDPQYYKTGILTKESDVFSFGVVMVEVLCGRFGHESQDELILYERARHCYEAGELDKIIIPGLLYQMNSLSLEKFSNTAYHCLNDDRKKRPNMTYIVQELKAALELQVGKLEQTELWGSNRGGDPWSYLFINNRKLRKIIIGHGEYCIHSITFIVEDINGSSYSSNRYGGGGPISYEISEVILDVDEEVIGISGTVATWDPLDKVISSLCFKTNKKNYEVGEPKHIISEFSKSWDVGSLVGFHVRCGFYLDGFGCYLKNWNASI